MKAIKFSYLVLFYLVLFFAYVMYRKGLSTPKIIWYSVVISLLMFIPAVGTDFKIKRGQEILWKRNLLRNIILLVVLILVGSLLYSFFPAEIAANIFLILFIIGIAYIYL